MLKVSKPANDRLDIELSGLLNAESMDKALSSLVEQSKGVKDGKMLYTITDFEMPTLGALAVELQHMPKLFGLLGKFRKCAVLSDEGWIRTFAEIEGAMIPNLEIKSFALASRQAAEKWLEGSDVASDDEEDENENFPV